MRRTLTISFILFCIWGYGQDEENWRTIPSVTDWIEEINNWPDSTYNQWYLKIRLDPVKDKDIVNFNPNTIGFSKTYDNPNDSIPLVEINKEVILGYVEFFGESNNLYNAFHLKNLHFRKGFSMLFLKNNRIGFDRCVFGGATYMRLMETRFLYALEDCHFKDVLYINNPTKSTRFTLQNNRFDKFAMLSSDEQPISLRLVDNEMGHAFSLGEGTVFKEVNITGNNLTGGLDFRNIAVSNAIRISDNSMVAVDLNGAVFPNGNGYMPFEQFSHKLTVGIQNAYLDAKDTGDLPIFYTGSTPEEILDKENFDALIASYAKLLDVYKSRSEMDSYNACYIQMKDKLTDRTKLLHLQDPSFNRYFDWQINRFTKVFSDYGTRPAKAILIFFQVVLAFSIFYFFFPSTWNTTNNRKLMKRLSYLGSYFTSNEGLSDLFEKQTKDEYKDYEEFHQFISSSEKQLPVYFQWLSKPLYRASVSRFNLSKRVLLKTDILNGKWAELPPRKKTTTSILVGLYLFFYLIYVLLVRCLNAITLSLNAFSTLGFGEIPTRGLARYVTIIQGFVGWFLLSIFLVSLIGQILN